MNDLSPENRRTMKPIEPSKMSESPQSDLPDCPLKLVVAKKADQGNNEVKDAQKEPNPDVHMKDGLPEKNPPMNSIEHSEICKSPQPASASWGPCSINRKRAIPTASAPVKNTRPLYTDPSLLDA